MKHKMTQFTIYIDDIELAKYCSCGLIDWVFTSFGQGDFLQSQADEPENGEQNRALQSSLYSLITGRNIGLEFTTDVKIIEKVKSSGGQVGMPMTDIFNVGRIANFLDSDGNLIFGMQSDN